MKAMRALAARWYRSLYFRIAFTFVVFVVAVLVAQSAMLNYIRRPRNPFPNRSPNNIAAIVAADVASQLAQTSNLDVEQYVAGEYGRASYQLYVVMKNRKVAANSARPLAESILRSVTAVLDGVDFKRSAGAPLIEVPGPVVMAPILVAGELRGMVVMPPPQPPGGPVVRDLSRLLSGPGTVLLIVITIGAAAFIFEPARRRLKALEEASERLGSGDLTARAPEGGGDEIARVATAFNQMANELAARDEALRTSDRLRRQMVADVSHELKTPLTSMRGYIETLHMADVSLDEATRERYFATVERETLRLDRIVKELLDLARLEHGGGPLERRVFAAARLFSHVIERHQQEAAARRIAISSVVAETADQVLADPDRIEQVLENLVANALGHTPDGGSVLLQAAADADAIVLAVIDSGDGIPPEHVPYVFDRFYKADPARAAGTGSGLGLAITKAIVERHGGTIRVESRPGRTVFTIRLPQNDTSDGGRTIVRDATPRSSMSLRHST